MNTKLNILGINGSASQDSSNLALLKMISKIKQLDFKMTIIDDLTELPHFRTELTDHNTPKKIIALRNQIQNADGIIICSPEYVFSIPSGLKNAIEWCVSTTVFSNKPLGLITASASGKKSHEDLKLIMKTIEARFSEKTTLLISGIKGKINKNGELEDENTIESLNRFLTGFLKLINSFES